MEFIRDAGDLETLREGTIEEKKQILGYRFISSPIGQLTIVASRRALVRLGFGAAALEGEAPESGRNAVLDLAATQISEYFEKRRTEFEIPLEPMGTEFQMRAWSELRNIPYGERISYAEQARRLGKPKAFRAVGAANGRNPIAIIIPCHRVVGSSGDLTGFGGGIEAKRHLLALEQRLLFEMA